MKAYKRTTKTQAIQFTTEAFHENSLQYPMVFDKAMSSVFWEGKKAEDGRYYLVNQTNTKPCISQTDVGEGDYIITEETGWYYTLPASIFEKNYKEDTV